MKILAVQNRMGIGDTVIFLPYIEAISKKFDVPVSLLVKKSSKVDQYIKQIDYGNYRNKVGPVTDQSPPSLENRHQL